MTGLLACSSRSIEAGLPRPEREARDQLKASADYVLSAVWWSDEMAQNARTVDFVKKFSERYKRSPDWYEALGYEAVRAVLEAAVPQFELVVVVDLLAEQPSPTADLWSSAA